MKNPYLIGGTMGVGKTSACQQLKVNLSNSVFLDGDWCWDTNTFQVTDETKAMVLENICYLPNNFLYCSAYENMIFCWVMHQQTIIDFIVEKYIPDPLDSENCDVTRKKLTIDVENGIRSVDVINRSIDRITLYQSLNTIKIDTCNKTVPMSEAEIKKRVKLWKEIMSGKVHMEIESN